jgi:hypothetical protein
MSLFPWTVCMQGGTYATRICAMEELAEFAMNTAFAYLQS